MVNLDIQKMAKLKTEIQIEPLSYPSCCNYGLKGEVREEFSKSGWVLTRQVWRILLMERKLDKEMDNENESRRTKR